MHANGISNSSDYFVPREARKVLEQGLLKNPLIAKDLPDDIHEAASKINFKGSPEPSIPVNWRFAEAAASLKGLEAALVNVLLDRKYNVSSIAQDVTIDTDHATLFIMSAVLWTIDPEGLNITAARLRQANEELEKFFPSNDTYRSHASLHRALATNIYKCKDGKYFNTHGSLNPDPTLDSLGLTHDTETTNFDEGVQRFQDAMGRLDSDEMQKRCTEQYRQAGTICWSVDEFRNSEHGKANKDVGLWEIHDKFNTTQPPCWWPNHTSTGTERPLAGLKVVDLTRIIAAPAVTRGLAELGASVMRCTSPHLPDVSSLHPDLNWGKWNCSIDLKDPDDRERLKNLILDADVVVQGYRPGALDKYGFSQQAIIDMCASRPRGIISVRENCYGWHGPWKDRSGWQQISDANVGVSLGFGQAMGHGEPVTPIFPHADYCTGISGICAILVAILRRGEKGGSYSVDLALNYYSSWLVNSVGEYPRPVFKKAWAENDSKAWHHYHHNAVTVPETMKTLRAGQGGERLFKPEFFEDRSAPGILGKRKMRQVKPVTLWKEGVVQPGFGIGARGNGTDAAQWPEDLSVEIVA